MYDLIIIGAGPAGISAGIYAASRGMKTLILEKTQVGGLIGKVSTVTHYAGMIKGESGSSFAKRLKEQAEAAGIEIRYEEVIRIDFSSEYKTVATEVQEYRAGALILANGTSPRMLNIPGEQELSGKGMRMNAASDAQKYTGKHVYVVGGADGAVKEAIYLAGFAKQVTVIHFEEKLGCIAEFRNKVEQLPNIDMKLRCRLKGVYGKEQVEYLELQHEEDGSTERIEDAGCGIFVYAGTVPNSGLYSELEMKDGFICTDAQMRTSVPGVYAVGDLRVKTVRQVSTAVADGTIAAITAASERNN